ncbi:MAG: flagellar protein FlgN [Desulfobacterales bacterium]
MRDTLNELLVVLDKLEHLYRALHGALENEREALIAANLSGFMVAKDRKEAFLKRLEGLGGQYRRLVDLLAADLGLSDTEFTVSHLIQRLPAADVRRLKTRVERLGENLAPTAKLYGVNRALCGAFQEFTRQSLAVLQGLRRPGTVYRCTGQMHRAACSGTLLAADF